jgi:hypothetical protein
MVGPMTGKGKFRPVVDLATEPHLVISCMSHMSVKCLNLV